MMIRTTTVLGACLALVLAAAPVSAQQSQPDPASTPPPPPAQTTAPATSNPDIRLDPLQPDFVLDSLPTNLRMPEHRFAFMVTHRFNRPLGRGDFGDLLSDFFGFDDGAQIGLELRYGLLPGTQIGVYRTSDRTIEIFGQQSVWQEKPDGRPLSIDIVATLEGTNNMQGKLSSALGFVVSKKVSRFAALYAEPMYVINTNPTVPANNSDNNTMIFGLGGRLRIRPTVYLVGEVTPRLTGYEPGVNAVSFGLEARAGGHQFQINFSNGFGTTLGQLALGAGNYDNWFIGFNISRKFF